LREFEPELVVNFAAETHVDRSINEPSPFIHTNIMGVFTVLETIRRLDMPRYIHVYAYVVYSINIYLRLKYIMGSTMHLSGPKAV